MGSDPWSRPTLSDLQRVLESIEKCEFTNCRSGERLELSVPAELLTSRGNVVPAMTREISRNGVGLFHRGSVRPGEATLRLASETRDFEYRLQVTWCRPCGNGMFISGGHFIRKDDGADSQ